MFWFLCCCKFEDFIDKTKETNEKEKTRSSKPIIKKSDKHIVCTPTDNGLGTNIHSVHLQPRTGSRYDRFLAVGTGTENRPTTTAVIIQRV